MAGALAACRQQHAGSMGYDRAWHMLSQAPCLQYQDLHVQGRPAAAYVGHSKVLAMGLTCLPSGKPQLAPGGPIQCHAKRGRPRAW